MIANESETNAVLGTVLQNLSKLLFFPSQVGNFFIQYSFLRTIFESDKVLSFLSCFFVQLGMSVKFHSVWVKVG